MGKAFKTGYHGHHKGASGSLSAFRLKPMTQLATLGQTIEPGARKKGEDDETSKDLFFACLAFVILLVVAVADLAFRF